MVGNDVVDRGDPESDPATLHPRFDSRVFSARERTAIAAARDSACERWIHWTAKEAAYKAAKKRSTSTVFSPRKFEATIPPGPEELSRAAIRKRRGELVFEGTRFEISIMFTTDFIHALAYDDCVDPGDLLCEVACLPATEDSVFEPAAPGRVARELCLTRLAPVLGVRRETLSIQKQGRIPMLFASGRGIGVDLSLSHHGRFVAFAADASSRSLVCNFATPTRPAHTSGLEDLQR